MKIKTIIEYELHALVSTFKKTTTWMYILSLLAIILAIFKQMVLIVIVMLIIIILQSKKDVIDGKVRAFEKEKYFRKNGDTIGFENE